MTAARNTHDSSEGPAERGPRRRAVLVALSLLATVLFLGFVALGTWQVYRRAWKLDLIRRVDQRVHAPVASPPGPAQWAQVTAATDEYRHVRVSGHFLDDRQTQVQASTDLGSGFWLLTPLVLADGTTVLINRGFVSPGWQPRHAPDAENNTTVTGLLRISEPNGGFLRKNDSLGNRWFSRDVAAIAAARGLTRVAPYFIDAEATPPDASGDPPTEPVGGLTVIAFHNSHLVYAITWYGLALMVALGTWRVAREERRLRQRGDHAATRAPSAAP